MYPRERRSDYGPGLFVLAVAQSECSYSAQSRDRVPSKLAYAMLPVDSALLVVLADLSESVSSGFILLRSLTLFSSSAIFFVRFPGSSGTFFFLSLGFRFIIPQCSRVCCTSGSHQSWDASSGDVNSLSCLCWSFQALSPLLAVQSCPSLKARNFHCVTHRGAPSKIVANVSLATVRYQLHFQGFHDILL